MSEKHEKVENRPSGVFTLPPNADAEHIDAAFKDGVLTLSIPKTEAAKPRSIAVK